ncbi:MAG: peptidoglycan editing factor PgeF [Candidatus Kapaibacteriales bacterium]
MKIGSKDIAFGITLTSKNEPFSFKSVADEDLPRKELAQALGIDRQMLATVHQKHTDIVVKIETEEDALRRPIADGMITNRKDMVLAVSLADCAGVALYHPPSKTLGLAHSGWRGTEQNITERTLVNMAEASAMPLDIFAKNVVASISPSASCANYEVGSEFKEKFDSRSFKEIYGKLHFDNKIEIYHQLLNLGVDESSISISDKCSISNEKYHSHRRDGANAGRMAAFVRFTS